MKALSIRQPWAELIISGRKTVELRSWPVNYRGPLAIHAAQTVDREACAAHGLDPEAVTTGAVIGAVDLVAVEPLEAEAYAALREAHLGREAFKPPLFGWQLQNPQRWPAPVPARGKMALFEVPDPKPQGPAVMPEPAAPYLEDATRNGRGAKTKTENTERPFELRVMPGSGTYSLALFQQLMPGREAASRYPVAKAGGANKQNVRVAELSGPALRAVTDQVLDALRHSGYRATDLSAGRREPFRLSEETGLRLGLLFLAVKPLTKLGRVDAIAEGLRGMASEEAYYWYSKCTAAGTADRAQKALRVLLAED